MARTSPAQSPPNNPPPQTERTKRLGEWLEQIGAKHLWSREVQLAGDRRLQVTGYAARGGSLFVVVERETREHAAGVTWSGWRDGGWEIYVSPTESGLIDANFAAAEWVLRLSPPPMPSPLLAAVRHLLDCREAGMVTAADWKAVEDATRVPEHGNEFARELATWAFNIFERFEGSPAFLEALDAFGYTATYREWLKRMRLLYPNAPAVPSTPVAEAAAERIDANQPLPGPRHFVGNELNNRPMTEAEVGRTLDVTENGGGR